MRNALLLVLTTVASNGFAQDIHCDLVTNTTTFWPAPTVSKPEYLQPITDPTFGTTITRIVGNPGEPIPNLPGTMWAPDQERHEYSKLSVWNCDQSMMYLNRHYPNLWLDGNTYEVLFTRTKPSSYVLWSHTEPTIMYHTGRSGNCHLGKWDVVKDVSTELVDLRAYTSCSFGESEGNFSWDGTKTAVYGKRISDNKDVVFVVDLVARTKGVDIEVTAFDNCTMSPKGTYVVIEYSADMIQVRNASDGTLVWSDWRYGLPSHFDVQIDQNGDEVVAGVGKTSPYNGLVIKRRLSDGVIAPLTTSGYASHTSGRNLRRPGWVYVTYQNLQTNSQYLPYINEIDAVKLDGSRVERICNIRVNKYLFPTPDDQYLAEAHACPSPDGLRVIFASDWDKGGFPVQAYVVDFRDKLISTSVAGSGIARPDSKPPLLGNYPNPFNPKTGIRYQVPGVSDVRLVIHDVLGREVAVLVNERKLPGRYEVTFDGSALSSGLYICHLTAGSYAHSMKMLLVK
jgi:hypothetical protein